MSRSEIINVTDIYKTISHRKMNVRNLSQIQFLMIHHSGSKNLPLPKLYDLHTKELHKWPTIGYHFYVTKANIIYQVNELRNVVNGCKNFNTQCIHICFEGDYETEIAPFYAKNVIEDILFYLRSINVKVKVTVHADHRKTLCCGKNLIKLVNDNFTDKSKIPHLIWPELEN